MIVYHEITGSNDDNLVYASVQINNVNYFDIICKDIAGTYPYSSANQYLSLYNTSEDTWGIKFNNAKNVTAMLTVLGDFGIMSLEFELADADLYAPDYTLKFTQCNVEDDGSDYNSGFTKPAVNGWPPIAISGVDASDDLCKQVKVKWTVNSGYTSDLFYKIP